MTAPWVSGPIHAVPCANKECGKPNDLRGLQEHILNPMSGLGETGASYRCDHCDTLQEVAQVQRVIMVSVREGTHRSVSPR